jgi:hypothetical protein
MLSCGFQGSTTSGVIHERMVPALQIEDLYGATLLRREFRREHHGGAPPGLAGRGAYQRRADFAEAFHGLTVG